MTDEAGIESRVEAAVARHRAGDVAEAERLYFEVLKIAPRHWRAGHNLGAILLARQQPARAVGLLKMAMEEAPEPGKVWLNYARALVNTLAFETAEALIAGQRADPRAAEMELRLRQAWGAKLMEVGRPALAEDQFRRALNLTPDDPDAIGDLCHALLALGRYGEAEALLRQAVERAPGTAGLRVNLGSALFGLGRPGEAEAEYRAALAIEPDNAAALQNLRRLLEKTGRADEAAGLADTEAARRLRARAAIKRSDALNAQGRYEESLAACEAAVALAPDDAEIAYERAFPRLLLCDFQGGWRDYEMRWRVNRFVDESSMVMVLPDDRRFGPGGTVEDLRGKRVLLLAEQGVGDQIMFASMLPDLARVAGQVTFVCDSRLAGLFGHAFPDIEVLGAAEADVRLSQFDTALPIGSLGRLFRNAVADFPGRPYLRPREEVRARWAERLGPRPSGLRIGVSWRGGLARTGLNRRSLALTQLGPILDLPGCEFVSLQYGEVAEEISAFDAGRAAPLRAFPKAEIDDFEELAGLIRNLDLVVSVQNVTVHMCGALGTTCLALLPIPPEWRYTARAPKMPWYDSVELFRQPRPQDWPTPLAAVLDRLRGA